MSRGKMLFIRATTSNAGARAGCVIWGNKVKKRKKSKTV